MQFIIILSLYHNNSISLTITTYIHTPPPYLLMTGGSEDPFIPQLHTTRLLHRLYSVGISDDILRVSTSTSNTHREDFFNSPPPYNVCSNFLISVTLATAFPILSFTLLTALLVSLRVSADDDDGEEGDDPPTVKLHQLVNCFGYQSEGRGFKPQPLLPDCCISFSFFHLVLNSYQPTLISHSEAGRHAHAQLHVLVTIRKF